MKLSTLWLREWVNFSCGAEELAAQLTMLGLEVDAVAPVAGKFDQVLIAQVLSTKPHPDADKLTLCEVNVDADTPLKIVCGASNVRPGLKVALAMIGAKLPGGLQIKESRLRGELSQGMLCSASELGLADQSEGIMELEEEAPIGMDLREYLSLEDQIFDIDLTPNRADCLSVLGIAREVAAQNKLPLLEPAVASLVPTIDDVSSLGIENGQACPRYCARIIRNISTQIVTPVWLSERLRRSGIRAVHPVVDVMNYVMLELGQPMHAFDLAKLTGGIKVRFSTGSEKLELLGGQEVTLSDKVLVIADDEKPLAMAGIIGGADSAIQAHTQDLWLESAYFNPVTIAGVARAYGLFSDASQRYERGIDPSIQKKALERATALILSILGGQAGPVMEACSKEDIPIPPEFYFDTSKVKKLTGLNISFEEMKSILQRLGIFIADERQDIFKVTIPSYRLDIQQEVDLVEEITRLYGYENVTAQPIYSLVQAGKINEKESMAKQLAYWFRDRGYHETISYSFVDPELQNAMYASCEVMQLLNPISPELSQMRVGMWPGLIASMMHNIHRQHNVIKCFEIGVVFDVHQGKLSERACIAGLLTGELGSLDWNEPTRFYDFFDLKGDLQSLFSLLKIENVEYLPSHHEALHPGQTAQILINKQPVGWIGALHPRLLDSLDISTDVIVFEINIEAMIHENLMLYQKISKYPQIRRDLSFLVDESVNVSQIENLVRCCIKDAHPEKDWLRSFDVFDVYIGKEIPEGKKSLAITMVLQDENRTLIDTEINLLISAIIKTLQNEFLIILRE